MCQNCQGTMVFLFTIFWGIAHSCITSVLPRLEHFQTKTFGPFKAKVGGPASTPC